MDVGCPSATRGDQKEFKVLYFKLSSKVEYL